MRIENFKFSSKLFLAIIIFQFVLAPITKAGGINSIHDKVGGGSTTTTSQESSGSSSTIYIVGGLALGALLIWKFAIKKKDKKEEEKSEESEKSALLISPDSNVESSDSESALPFEVNLSLQKIMPNVESRSVVVGVSLPF